MNAKQTLSLFIILVCYNGTIAGAAQSEAQSYPTKPIRMICPSAPGGTTDLSARLVAQNLTEAWGKQVVVDNRPGSGGGLGTELVARAAPDGYTLLLGTITSHAINPALNKHLNFDPIKDFSAVSLVVSSPQLLAVNPALPVRSVKDLIALAKAKPGQVNYGSAGTGNSSHLVVELFKIATGTNLVHVPYKGSGPAITGVVSNEVQMIITGVVALSPHLKSGRLRGVAVTSAKRVPAFPELPTFVESGIEKFDVSSWFGVFVPAHTPKSIIGKLNYQIRKMLEDREIQKRLTDSGAEPSSSTPEQFTAFVRSELARWDNVVKQAHIPTH
jgi:tripartite-type tricarboxylate transporter receptor subunit TctC